MPRQYPRIAAPLAAPMLLAMALAGVLAGSARGDVVIVSNRSPALVNFSAKSGSAAPRKYSLGVGDMAPIACQPHVGVRVAFLSAGKRRDYTLQPNSVYFFHRAADSEELDLEQIGITHAAHKHAAGAVPAPAAPEPGSAPGTTGPPPLTKIKVKILVDDDEHAVRALWEERLRKRVAAASRIFEKYAGIALEVVACETWESNDELRDFEQLLRDFETKVKPDPADVALGFSSQYSATQGRAHLGGTRGPLGSHILLREWSRHMSEPERLELLVHELGHYFGAAHSPEPASVMRPVLADRKSVARRFLIVFDPVNALAMYLVGEELRERNVRHLYQIDTRTRDVLIDIYLTLGKSFPEDPAAAQYLALLGESPPATGRRGLSRAPTVVDSARAVRDAVVDVADRNRRLPRTASAAGGAVRISGDALTEIYVRTAARAACELPVEHRQKAFALGLAVAVADTELLQANSLTRDLLPRLETSSERERRLDVIGAPTLQGRNDLAKHFCYCAAIAAMATSAISESAGLLKEMQDARGESGFSFTDVAADLAGIALVDYLRASGNRLHEVAENFSVERFVPSVAGLPDGLSLAEFQERYGSTSDPRFMRDLALVRDRVRRLPAYAQSGETDSPPREDERR